MSKTLQGFLLGGTVWIAGLFGPQCLGLLQRGSPGDGLRPAFVATNAERVASGSVARGVVDHRAPLHLAARGPALAGTQGGPLGLVEVLGR